METNFDKRVIENRICEVCDTNEVQLCTMSQKVWYCRTCWDREIKVMAEHSAEILSVGTIPSQSHNSTSAKPIPTPLSLNAVLREAASIDQQVNVRPDLFNAATKSIVEMKQAIDADASITNKAYALAEALKNRFEHFKTVVFELNQQLVEAGNNQKAIQVYLNNLANQLRADEREKLRIQDINYKPAPPKVAKPKTVTTTTTKKKIDKKELREAAARLGVSEFTLQMIVVQRGISVADAENVLKASIAATKG